MDMQYEPLPQPSGISVCVLATRPQFLTITVLAVLLGTVVASYEQHQINWMTLTLSLIAAVLIHGGADVLNDYYDDLSGADRINIDPLTPYAGGSRVIQRQLLTSTQMFKLGWSMFGIATLLGLWLVALTGPLLLVIGSVGLVLGVIYSAPPVALSYRGFGEVVIAFTFGVLPVLGAYYVQTGTISLLPFWIGMIAGLLTAAILFVNQFPDYKPDKLSNKRTIVVRLGPYRAAQLYPLWATTAALILLTLVVLDLLPALVLCALLPLPLVWKNTHALKKDYSSHEGLAPVVKGTIAIHAMVIGLMILALLDLTL
jgi:1,4-dihydroxy-2-naphthoate octaprenyltransferase